MIFEDAYSILPEGTEVVVSDGSPEPPDKNTLAWRQWRSHNHRGRIFGKKSEGRRAIIVEVTDLPEGEFAPAYEIPEGTPHFFDEVTSAAKLSPQAQGRRAKAQQRGRLARMTPLEIVEDLETRMLAAMEELLGRKLTQDQRDRLFPNARTSQ